MLLRKKQKQRLRLAAVELAAERIRTYHQAQLPEDRDYRDDTGTRLGARWRAVDAAGLYVPGGRAAYPSSLLMNAIPARVAGVGRLVVVTPTPKGVTNPLVLAAAHIAGVGLPASLAELGMGCDGRRLADHMLHDKKMDAGTLPFVLLRSIGEAFLDKQVSLEDVAAFLDGELRG